MAEHPVWVPAETGIDHTLPDQVMLQVRLHLVNGRYQVRPVLHCTTFCCHHLNVCTSVLSHP